MKPTCPRCTETTTVLPVVYRPHSADDIAFSEEGFIHLDFRPRGPRTPQWFCAHCKLGFGHTLRTEFSNEYLLRRQEIQQRSHGLPRVQVPPPPSSECQRCRSLMGGYFCMFCRTDWSTKTQDPGSTWERIKDLPDGETLTLPHESRREQALRWLARFRPAANISLVVVRPEWTPQA